MVELQDLRSHHQGPWLIYKAEDKNNVRLNRRVMGLFRKLLQDLELTELRLHAWPPLHLEQRPITPRARAR